jgi:hypothetical protein
LLIKAERNQNSARGHIQDASYAEEAMLFIKSSKSAVCVCENLQAKVKFQA